MSNAMKFIYRSLVVTSLCYGSFTYSMLPQEQAAQQQINELYRKPASISQTNMIERLRFFSHFFLDKPYLLYSLGEGEHAKYDQHPLFRTDGFDCETYVDTVLALALATEFNTFKQCILAIRYTPLPPSFMTRNHFTDLNWNQNLQKRTILKDVTLTIKDEKMNPVAKIATTTIDRQAWFKKIGLDRVYLPKASSTKRQAKRQQLQDEGKHTRPEISTIPYLPLEAMFDKKGHPITAIFKQIPEGAIIEIVRPNWDLRKQIGTYLNVSHLGFVFLKNNHLVFREASSEFNKVVDVKLEVYLKKALNSPTIKGINIQVVKPEKPSPWLCE
jgi:hypothetical protein